MNKYDYTEESCQVDVVHQEVVDKVKEAMPVDDILYDLAELFKIFGDSTRIKILSALKESELCVCDIASVLDMTKSAVSHQLRILRGAKLVRIRRQGKEIYYSLDDEHVGQIFSIGLEHIEE
jgi:ArsR family transcriptional regulator